MVKRFKWLVLVAALTVCLTLSHGPHQACNGADWSLSRLRKSIGDGLMRPVRWLTGVSARVRLSRGSPNDDDRDSVGGDDDGKEQFEAMCLVSREPNLKGPPEVMFFSKKSHSSSTLGCSQGQASIKLEPSSLESSQSEAEARDGELKRQLVETKLYDGSLSTYFIIHGFLASWESTWMCDLKDMILNGSQANVFIVDWSGGAIPLLPIDYGGAVTNTKLVANLLANFIKSLLRISSSSEQPEASDVGRFHMIGHSLGGQISGFVGYSLDGQLGRITALDPAGPCFSQQRHRTGKPASGKDASVEGYLDGQSDRRRLSASSAKLVIALHTDCSLFGLDENCAHYDVYVNGGHRQPGCSIQSASQLLNELIHANLASKIGSDITCSHSYGHDLIETFDTDDDSEWSEAKCYPMAYECSSWEAFYAGECGFCFDNDAKCVFVGLGKNVSDHDSIAPTIMSKPDQTSTSLVKPQQNKQADDDCRFNGEWNCGNGGSASDTISFLGSRMARSALLTASSFSSSSSSSSSSSTPNYLISAARHFIRSGESSQHCVYHYQVLIAINSDECQGNAGRKYYLRIPLKPGADAAEAERVVQVSNKIDKSTPSYSHIENNYLSTMKTIYEPMKKLADGPSDYFSALITFRPDCSTDDRQSLCRPMKSLDGAELWSTDDTPVKGVQWVAINFMSSPKLETRIKYSHILQVGSDDVRDGSDYIKLQKVI